MVPNNVVLTVGGRAAARARRGRPARAAAPGRQAERRPGAARGAACSTPVRHEPHIALEEIDADEVVVRIAATPESEADGPRLADEILASP